jgi:hypothetical protein
MDGENGIINDDEIDGQMKGGRRHRGSKKRHSKRRGNASLRAWVTFVKKVQREEKVSYKEAMMRAKKRKDRGEKWRGGAADDDMDMDMEDEEMDNMDNMEEDEESSGDDMSGGRRRRRTRRRRGSKKRRRGRKSRRYR